MALAAEADGNSQFKNASQIIKSQLFNSIMDQSWILKMQLPF